MPLQTRSAAFTVFFVVACGGAATESEAQPKSEQSGEETEGEWKVSSGRSVVTLEDGQNGAERSSSASIVVQLGNLQVNGGHVGASIKKSLIRERFAFEPCYLESDSSKTGQSVVLSVDLFVHEDGRISEPKVKGYNDMLECVAERLAESEAMPNGPERTRVRFRVLLQPKSDSAAAAPNELTEPF